MASNEDHTEDELQRKRKKHDTEEDTMITKKPKSSNEVDKLQIIYTEITNSYYIHTVFFQNS